MVVVEEESDDKVFGGEWEKYEATAWSLYLNSFCC